MRRRRATGGDPMVRRAGSALRGQPAAGSNGFSTFVAAPFGVAAALDAGAGAWLDAVSEAVRGASQDTVEDSVALPWLPVMTGNFPNPAGCAEAAGNGFRRIP